MIWNYIKIAFRNLARNKAFSIINILGLSVGLAASLLIALWVFDEWSYDKFNENYNRIYRVERFIHFDGKITYVPVTGAIYGKTINERIPEVEDFTRIYDIELSVWNYKNSNSEEVVIFADTGFFQVFTFPFLRGNPETALKEPFSVVLTKKAAVAYFGEEYPMDKILEIEWGDERKKYRVTGIIDEVPNQSHFHFNVLASFPTLEELMPERMDTWLANYLYTYVMLYPGTAPENLEPKMRKLVEEFISPAYQAFLGERSDNESIHDIFQITLRPVGDIHLKANLLWDIEPQGNITTVYIFSIVSILILLMACFNFMNLSTALGSKRSREVGIRKTVGAARSQLILQFLSESIVISLISVMFALLIIEIVLPGFNTFTGKTLNLYTFLTPEYFLVLAAIVIGTGVLAGLYPAFYLSHFDPMVVLRKQSGEQNKRFSLRQVLVILQFSISILLIIVTITVYLQIKYFSDKPLGYDQENLFVISTESNEVRSKLESFKNILLQYPEVTNVTMSGAVPAATDFGDRGFKADGMQDIFLSIFFVVGYDFFETYGIELLAGRYFSKEYGTDTLNKYIVNERVLKKIGIANPEDAIGVHYGSLNSDGNIEFGEIIGVVKDFHFKPLNHEIEPITFALNFKWSEYITVRFASDDLQGFVSKMEENWKNQFPNNEYNYFFLKDWYESLYVNESRMQNILLVFTFLAIFIGCLGLFGLAAFVAQQRSKEIGIRKVHGASVNSIMILLSRKFAYWVLLANLLAWPVAYYFIDNWLSKFYYRIAVPYWVFIASGLAALLLAVVTVSYRAYKAASVDPVESIKYE